jgi:SIR2-like domain
MPLNVVASDTEGESALVPEIPGDKTLFSASHSDPGPSSSVETGSQPPTAMNFSEAEWNELVEAIKDGSCIPFLGAGACVGYLPTGTELAEKLSEIIRFPVGNSDRRNLTSVATYTAVETSLLGAKRKVVKILNESKRKPDFKGLVEPHGILATLPFRLYLTTNYDDLLTTALESYDRLVTREVCRWSDFVNDLAPQLSIGPDFKLHPARPIVFHLHGYDALPASLVLTEDDYLEFISNFASRADILPPVIKRAMVGSTFLFLGYRLNDWNLRILFQGLRKVGTISNVAVIRPSQEGSPEDQAKIQRYLEKHYGRTMDLKIVWTTATTFCTELKRRYQLS